MIDVRNDRFKRSFAEREVALFRATDRNEALIKSPTVQIRMGPTISRILASDWSAIIGRPPDSPAGLTFSPKNGDEKKQKGQGFFPGSK